VVISAASDFHPAVPADPAFGVEKVSRTSSPFLENFIQNSYPDTNLPPLWQIIYQEAVRGHHILFNRLDVERYDRELSPLPSNFNLDIPEEVELIVLHLVECPDLQSMVRVIDRQPDRLRKCLYQLYQRVIWMWCHYVKNQLN
jgi:hypothetical protein